ncbi:MAG: hypothetical protein ABIH83_01685 [Candidatus Micrarchaeota archaeon]
MELPNPYKGDYKKLVILPILLAILCLVSIFFINPIRKGIDFKGGIDVEMLSDDMPNTEMLKSELEGGEYVVNSIEANQNPSGYLTQAELERSAKVVEADEIKTKYYELREEVALLEANAAVLNDSEAKQKYAEKRVDLDLIANNMFELTGAEAEAGSFNTVHLLTKEVQTSYTNITNSENEKLRAIFSNAVPGASISFKERTSSLSASFIDKVVMVVIYSVIFTSIAVFLIFRSVIPSIAVLAGAVADIIFALGAMSIFDIPLTLASFAALLMLVGFSLDTDILLTMRVMKRREGTAAERAYDSMKTGMTMSLSTMVAFAALLIIAFITHINIYYEIAAVAMAGLVGDLIATWAFNAVIILAHVQDLEKKGKLLTQRSLASYIFRS